MTHTEHLGYGYKRLSQTAWRGVAWKQTKLPEDRKKKYLEGRVLCACVAPYVQL